MKIGLIADIHGSLPALEAVLAYLRTAGVERIWNAGDAVGYGPFPDPVVSLLKDSPILNIQGNYDRKALHFEEKSEKWQHSKRHEKWLAFKFAWEQLSPANRKFLGELPEQREFEVEGWRVLLTHGSPASPDEHLSPLTPGERLAELSQLTAAELIVCGHSHAAFARRAGSAWFINPGSVGRPDDGDPRAACAVLELEPGSLRVSLIRIPYDISRTVQAVHELQLPEAFAWMAQRGRSLDAVLEQESLSQITLNGLKP